MAGRPTLAALARRFAGTWSSGRPVFDRTGLPARSALRNQFALKLQASNARIEYLVIDQLTRPANVQR